MRRDLSKCVVTFIAILAAYGCGGGGGPSALNGPVVENQDEAGGSGSMDGASGGGGDLDGSVGTGPVTDDGGPDTASTGDAGPVRPPKDAGKVTVGPLTFSDIGQPVLISSQFYFTEGPVWDPMKNVLYFTDINAPQNGKPVGAVYRLTLPSTFDVLLQPDGNADGLGLDPMGNIIAAGFASRSIWRLSNGTRQTLAGCSSPAGATCYNGQEVNTPDDITARSDGVIYFTDPTFASGGQGLPTQSLPLSGSQGVYRLTLDGMVHREDATTSGPNGVNLSPDEKTLYVAYTGANTVAKFDVAADGSLSGKQTFASAMLADSMCVDSGGNVYVGTSSGVAVFNPQGRALGTISVAGQIVTNCAFGGSDQRTLFITSRAQSTLVGTPVANDSSLYKIDKMPVPGIPGQN
jgi:gluconolactonase